MKELTQNDLKNKAVEILLSIDDFCRHNNLRYSLAYGTLLGAVRHKGYIPWDDDIDVMMPRDDYEKFIHSYKDGRFEIITHDLCDDYWMPFAKVHDKNTLIDEFSCMKPCFGVFVDVFPIDTYPDSEKENSKFLRKKKILSSIHDIKMITYRKGRKWYKNMFLLMCKTIVSPLSMSKLTRAIESLSVQYRGTDTEFAGIFSPTDNKPKWRMKRDIFEKYSTCEFEGHTVQCIEAKDTYLRNIYGDYMKLPPEKDRVSHHLFHAITLD